MSCTEYSELIQDLIDGRLSPAASAGVIAHVEECESCRVELEALQRTARLLRESAVPAWEGSQQRVMSTFRSRTASVEPRRPPHAGRLSLAAGLVATAVIAALLAFPRAPEIVDTPAQEAAIEVVSVDDYDLAARHSAESAMLSAGAGEVLHDTLAEATSKQANVPSDSR